MEIFRSLDHLIDIERAIGLQIKREILGVTDKIHKNVETALNFGRAITAHPFERMTERDTNFCNKTQAEIFSYLMNYLKPRTTPTEPEFIFLIEVLAVPFYEWFRNVCKQKTPRIMFLLHYSGQPEKILTEMIEAQHLKAESLQAFLAELVQQHRQKFGN